jgi:hypothetical protein
MFYEEIAERFVRQFLKRTHPVPAQKHQAVIGLRIKFDNFPQLGALHAGT